MMNDEFYNELIPNYGFIIHLLSLKITNQRLA